MSPAGRDRRAPPPRTGRSRARCAPTAGRPRSTTTSPPAATRRFAGRCRSGHDAVEESTCRRGHHHGDGVGPARPRRRRLLHRAQVEHHAARTGRTAPQVHRLQRRRDGAGQLQGPVPHGAEPAPAARGHAARRLRHGGGRGLHLPARPVPRARSAALDGRDRRGPRSAATSASDVLGSGFSFDIELHTSIGRYICGEATRDAERAREPAAQPARPAAAHDRRGPVLAADGRQQRRDLHGRARHRAARRRLVEEPLASPTRAAPRSSASPAAWRYTGCWELPMGTPMRELIEVHAGGMLPGYELRAVSPGGASTAFVGRRHRRAARLRDHGPGREPPRHRHAGPAGRPDLPRRHDHST